MYNNYCAIVDIWRLTKLINRIFGHSFQEWAWASLATKGNNNNNNNSILRREKLCWTKWIEVIFVLALPYLNQYPTTFHNNSIYTSHKAYVLVPGPTYIVAAVVILHLSWHDQFHVMYIVWQRNAQISLGEMVVITGELALRLFYIFVVNYTKYTIILNLLLGYLHPIQYRIMANVDTIQFRVLLSVQVWSTIHYMPFCCLPFSLVYDSA